MHIFIRMDPKIDLLYGYKSFSEMGAAPKAVSYWKFLDPVSSKYSRLSIISPLVHRDGIR